MTYLFLGDDSLAKDKEIEALKRKILVSDNAFLFDYVTLHARQMDSQTLKEQLDALPAIAPKRLIVVRESEKLNAHNKTLILDFVENDFDHAALILDFVQGDLKSSFIRKLKPRVKMVVLGSKDTINVFDVTRAIERRHTKEALKMLSRLFDEGVHPLQVMGGLLWSWGRAKGQMPRDRFRQGLTDLQEADFNIKRSRLKPEHALEVLIVKLCEGDMAKR